MKKRALLVAALLAVMGTSAALAQESPDGNGAPGGAPPPPAMGGMNGGMHDGKNFDQRKAEILQHMNEHLADVQKRIACVQAATDHKALRACMPMRHGGGFGGHESGPQGGPQGGPPEGGQQ
ncbi:MAG: hypothetical protein KGI37_07055 [Alphaproteobacteria bacterium]|nr:hypothetical protein [Alphaproteobacteria bacterium]